MTRLDDYVNVSGSSPLPENMQAVVLSGRGEENLNLTTVRVPECGDSQLLGRVDAAVASLPIISLSIRVQTTRWSMVGTFWSTPW